MADGQRTEAPEGLEHPRHVLLHGRAPSTWGRRIGVALLTALAAAALADVFGQRADAHSVDGPKASLTVDSPGRVRGGLVFTTKLVVRPHVDLADAQLRLDQDWFKGMTFNGLSPQPGDESSEGRWQVFDYGPLEAGDVLTVWISWQADPTAPGRRSQDAAVYDGSTGLVTARRELVVFP